MTFRILIKFGQHSHMEDLRSKGAVFTQPLRYFRELETDQARGDRLEGSTRILQPKHIGTMTLGTVVFEPHEIVGPVIFGLPEDQRCNVFCMYSITKPTDLYPIDKRVENFGPSFVMVLNTREFISRFSEAAKLAGLSDSHAGRMVTPCVPVTGSVHAFLVADYWNPSTLDKLGRHAPPRVWRPFDRPLPLSRRCAADCDSARLRREGWPAAFTARLAKSSVSTVAARAASTRVLDVIRATRERTI